MLPLLLLLTKDAARLRLVLLLSKETTASRGRAKTGGGRLSGTKEAARLLLVVLLTEKATGLLLRGLTKETTGRCG